MLGVMVLILVISVMSGFDRELRQKVLGFNPHLTITANTAIPDWKELSHNLGKQPHVCGVAPYIIGPVLVKHHGRVFAPFIKGLEPLYETKINNLAQYVVKGKFNLGKEQVVIGIEMARRYGIFLGDKITIYSPKNFVDTKVAYLPIEPKVAGVFETGMFDYDFNFILCSLQTAQDLYDLDEQVHGLAVMADTLESVNEVQLNLNKILKAPLHASSWIERNRRIFSAIATEKSIMFFLLIFITIVAAFGIKSTLIVVTVQKTREIGILKSLGATPKNVLSIFLAQGMMVGAIGTSLGLCFGLLLLRYRNEFLDFLRKHTGYELFPREIYNFDLLPAQTNLQDLFIICSAAFLICTLASLFPAWRAARLQPAHALRDF